MNGTAQAAREAIEKILQDVQTTLNANPDKGLGNVVAATRTAMLERLGAIRVDNRIIPPYVLDVEVTQDPDQPLAVRVAPKNLYTAAKMLGVDVAPEACLGNELVCDLGTIRLTPNGLSLIPLVSSIQLSLVLEGPACTTT